MFPLQRSLTARYLLQKWERSLLVAISIALGIATLVSTRLLNQCVEAAAYDTTIPADVADLYVQNGEAGVDWKVLDDLRAASIPGIRRVEPFVQLRVALPELDQRPAVIFGIDVEGRADQGTPDDGKLQLNLTPVDNPVAFLVWPVQVGRPVAISRRLYDERRARGKGDTDPIAIRYTNVTETFHLAYIIDVPKDSPVAPFAENLLIMDVAQAATFSRRPGVGGDRVTRIGLYVEPGADIGAVHERAQTVVGSRAQVRTPEAIRKSTSAVVGAVKLVLNLCSLGALIVGLFLVYNALAVTVAERRHDIGVMRSLGATRTQIAHLFTAEAMFLGALGSLPGIPLGLWLSGLAINQFGDELKSSFLNSESFRPHLSLETGLIAVLAGMATALLAALVPALQAASDEPADAVRRAPSTTGGTLRRIYRVACVLLVAGGFATVLLRRQLPSPTGSLIGGSLVLIGMFLAMPIFVGLFSRLFLPLCRWSMGVEARLAADNLVRSPARTGLVIGALAAGVSLMFLTAGVGKSNEVPIRNWLEEVIQADAFVFRDNPAAANSSMAPMEPGVRDQFLAVPGVEHVVGLKFFRAEWRGTFILLVAIDGPDYRQGVRARVPNPNPTLDLMERLPEGPVTIVSDNFAAKWGVQEGDIVTIQGPRGPVNLTVIGIGRDYSWNQGTIFVERTIFAELFGENVVDGIHVFFRKDADFNTTYERVRQVADREQLVVQNRESVQIYLVSVIDRLFRVAYLQQFIVAVVAALGVVTSLLISVLQRRRELGLLRAVGATQPQVLKSVLAEAMFMGLIGTILGFAQGLFMEWYFLHIVMREETGFVFDLLVPWKEALGIGLICVLTATAAGLIPAFHAVRLNIPEAIAYE